MFSLCLTAKKLLWKREAEETRERFIGLSETQMVSEI